MLPALAVAVAMAVVVVTTLTGRTERAPLTARDVRGEGAAHAENSACAASAAAAAAPSHTGVPLIDFFTADGHYMPRVHCMTTAEGRIDWPWIAAVLALSAGVIVAYLRVFVFWMQSYFHERPNDRNPKLFDLAAIFLLCAICGYGMSMLMFAWPGYRLLAFLLLLLNVFSWRFCHNLTPFRQAFAAGRLERQLRESVETRAQELERLVAARTAEANRLAEIARRTANGAIITDSAGLVEWVNEGFTRISGYSPRDVIGRPYVEVLRGLYTYTEPAARADAGLERLDRAFALAKPETVELTACGRDGRRYKVQVELVPLRDEEDAVNGFMSIETDVTEHHRYRAELLQRAEEFEHLRNAAEAASQAKSEFLANMSHEIRTPMTAILGFADLLALENESSAAQRMAFVDTIRRNGEHLLTIINDILDLSKIEAGMMTVERVAVEPQVVIADVESLMLVKAKAKGLTLNVLFEGEVPRSIEGDAVRMKQILVNLVGNAIKFTERGGVTLRVGCDRSKEQLRMEVADTGIGLNPEQLKRLFGAFVQGDASTTRKYGGTGLGLRISKHLAQLLGGDIAVASKPGIGSVFVVTVATGPLTGTAMVEPSRILAASTGAPPNPASTPSLQGVRILLAEDGIDNQRLISLYLRKAGAEVRVVENGRLAVEAMTVDGTLGGALIAPPTVDIVLTDMQMPEMDGYETARTLRSKGCPLPILALTAHAMGGDMEKCMQAGCDAYASKPVNREQLVRTCREMIDARTRQRGNQPTAQRQPDPVPASDTPAA